MKYFLVTLPTSNLSEHPEVFWEPCYRDSDTNLNATINDFDKVHLLPTWETIHVGSHYFCSADTCVSLGIVSHPVEVTEYEVKIHCASSAWWKLICATGFCFVLRPALPERLQCVPDKNSQAARAEGREGAPWSARTRRLGGREGTSSSQFYNNIFFNKLEPFGLSVAWCIKV